MKLEQIKNIDFILKVMNDFTEVLEETTISDVGSIAVLEELVNLSDAISKSERNITRALSRLDDFDFITDDFDNDNGDIVMVVRKHD